MTPGYGPKTNQMPDLESTAPTHITAEIIRCLKFTSLDRYRFARLFPDGSMKLTVANLALFDTGFINNLACEIFRERPHEEFHGYMKSANETWCARVRVANLQRKDELEFAEAIKNADELFRMTAGALLVDLIPKIFGE